jgi:hypothetical protein
MVEEELDADVALDAADKLFVAIKNTIAEFRANKLGERSRQSG